MSFPSSDLRSPSSSPARILHRTRQPQFSTLMPISRRTFVVSAGATMAALVGSPRLVLPWRRRYALVIRGGTVFDGLGSPGMEADVAIDNGRVVALGKNLQDEGAMVIDARG